METPFEKLFYKGKAIEEDWIELAGLLTSIKSAVQNNPERMPEEMQAEYLSNLMTSVNESSDRLKTLLTINVPGLIERTVSYNDEVVQAVKSKQ